MRSYTYRIPNRPNFSALMLNRVIVIMLIVAIFSTSVVAPAYAAWGWVGSVTSALGNFASKLECFANPNCLVDNIGEETRETLAEAAKEIRILIELLSDTYQDNLDFTIDKLDQFTRNKIFEIEGLMISLNSELQDTIKLASGELNLTIQNLGTEVRTTIDAVEESVKDVVAFTIAGVIYMIDRTTLNIIVVVSLVLLGIGLIVFASLLFKASKEQSNLRLIGIGLMIVHILFFGALVLSADFRARIIVTTQLGLRQSIEQDATRPEIHLLEPNPLDLQKHDTLEVWGSYLLRGGEVPEVTIKGQVIDEADVVAENTRLIIDTTNLSFENNLTTNLDLNYSDSSLNQTSIIVINERIAPPPQFPVSLSLKIINARFPSSLNQFFASPRVTLKADTETDIGSSQFFKTGTDVKFPGLTVTTSALRDELIPITVTFRSGSIMTVDEFELDWTELQNCDGTREGTCTVTHEERVRFQSNTINFTITYCMSVKAGGLTVTQGDPCFPDLLAPVNG